MIIRLPATHSLALPILSFYSLRFCHFTADRPETSLRLTRVRERKSLHLPSRPPCPSRSFPSPPLLQNPFLRVHKHKLGFPVLQADWPLLCSALQGDLMQRVRALQSGCLGIKPGSITVN